MKLIMSNWNEKLIWFWLLLSNRQRGGVLPTLTCLDGCDAEAGRIGGPHQDACSQRSVSHPRWGSTAINISEYFGET